MCLTFEMSFRFQKLSESQCIRALVFYFQKCLFYLLLVVANINMERKRKLIAGLRLILFLYFSTTQPHRTAVWKTSHTDTPNVHLCAALIMSNPAVKFNPPPPLTWIHSTDKAFVHSYFVLCAS